MNASGQPAVAGDRDDRDGAHLPLLEQREARGRKPPPGPCRPSAPACAPRTGASPRIRASARRRRAAATSSMARVILRVFLTERIRRSMSRRDAIYSDAAPTGARLFDVERVALNLSIAAFSRSASSSGRSFVSRIACVQLLVRAQVLPQLLLEARDLRRRDVVEVAVDARVDGDDLLLVRPRVVLRLVERRDHPLARARATAASARRARRRTGRTPRARGTARGRGAAVPRPSSSPSSARCRPRARPRCRR